MYCTVSYQVITAVWGLPNVLFGVYFMAFNSQFHVHSI